MKRALAFGFSLLAAVGFTTVVDTAPASAAGACAANHFCLYEDDDYKGQHAEFAFNGGTKIDLTAVKWAGGNGYVTNGASSMKNLTSHAVHLYDASDCSGSAGYNAKKNSVDTDFSNNSFDNKASCLQFS